MIDQLESRRLLATLNGTPNPDTITVDIVGPNIVITLNGVANSFLDATNTDIIVNGGGGNDIITVIRNGANPTTISGGSGNDTIRVGDGIYEGLILSPVRTFGDADTDTTIFNDGSGLFGDTYTVDSVSITRAGAPALTHGTERIVLNATGLDDTVVFENSVATQQFDFNLFGGDDLIRVAGQAGFGDLGAQINGTTFINGGSGIDSVYYDDRDNLTADVYTLDGANFTTSTMDGVQISSSTIELHAIFAATGVLAQRFDLVDADNVDVSVAAGDGNDTINIGSGDFDRDFKGVTVGGGSGTDVVVVDSSAETATNGWTLASSQLTRNITLDSILPTGVEQLTLNGGTGSELFSIFGMPSGLDVTINAGDGDDTLDASTGDDIDNSVTESLRFVGGAGDDLVDATDTSDGVEVTPENYSVSSTSLQKSASSFGSLTYSTIERLLLVGDGDASAIEYVSSSAGQRFTLNGGEGADTFFNSQSLIELGGFWAGDVTLNGGLGVDSVILDDSGEDDLNVVVAVELTGLVMDFTTSNGDTPSVTFSSVGTLTYTGNSTGESFTINSSSSLEFGLNGGLGDDTFTVGAGDLDNNGLGVNLVTVVGGSGTDSVIFNDVLDVATLGEIEEYDINYSLLGSGSLSKGPLVSVVLGGLERIEVDGSAAASTYDVAQIAIATTLNGGAGGDLFDTSDGNYNGFNIVGSGSLNINGGGGVDTVAIDDAGVATNDSYTFSPSQFGVNGLATLAYAGVERVEFEASTGDNTITITGTGSGTQYLISANAGNDVIDIGAGGVVDQVKGFVDVLGGSGFDTLNYNDQSAATARTYSMSLGRIISRTDAASVSFSNLVERVVVNAGTQGDTVHINGQNASITDGVTWNTGSGNDTINVGAGDFDSTILSPLTVTGGTGADSLVIDDATDNDPGDVYSLPDGFVTKSSTLIALRRVTLESIRLDLPAGNERVRMDLDGALERITVNGGLGDDTVDPLDDDLDSMPDFLFFDGQGGDDLLNLINTAQAAGTTDSIRFERASNTVGRVINFSTPSDDVAEYTSVEDIVLVDGPHSLRIDVIGTISGSAITVNGGDGNDTLSLGNALNNLDFIDSGIRFSGGNGVDHLRFDDTASSGPRTWTIESAFVDTTTSASVSYATTESVLVNAGSGDDTLRIEGTDEDTTYLVNGNGGADEYQVGDNNEDIDLNISGVITLDGGAGSDRLEYRDFGDNADPDAYLFTLAGDAESFTKSNTPAISARAIESRTLLANDGDNSIDVVGALPGLIIDAGAGVDLITVWEAGSPVVVRTGPGDDSLTVNDGSGVAEVIFDSSETLGDLDVLDGGRLTVLPNGGRVVSTNGLGLGGVIDLNDNMFIRRNASNFLENLYFNRLDVGYNGGLWNGGPESFVSSVAAASPRGDALGMARIGEAAHQLNVASIGGVPVAINDLVVRYTLVGDTDLDRDVDFADLLALAQNYDPSVGSRNWRLGNFNYNTADTAAGAVGFPDLLGLAQNYLAPFVRASSTSRRRVFADLESIA